MFSDFKIELDPPPHGFYTFEDNVSGRVVSEGTENIGWVYVFFHGWVKVQDVVMARPGYDVGTAGQFNNGPRDPNAPKWGDKMHDKEILFQNHAIIYQGYDKLKKKMRYEWPFSFSFQKATSAAYNLPSSGHYTFTSERNWSSNIQYKVVAVHGEIGQRDDDVRWMFNPSDPRYLREPPLKPTGIFLKIKEKLGGAAEQELKFVGIRYTAAVSQYMPPVHRFDLYVEGKHVPQLAPPSRYDDHDFRHTKFPFTVEMQGPSQIVIGQPFPVLLSISSSSNIWNRNPPEVILTSCKIIAYIEDIVTIRETKGDMTLRVRTIWDGKRLSIPLGSQPVDIGKIYSFALAGEEIVPSFSTQTLRREYNFSLELNVEVGGKSFEARFSSNQVTVLSPIVATGVRMLQTQPEEAFHPDFKSDSRRRFNDAPSRVQLHGSYIGRLTHDGAGLDRPLAEHSMMEAAITLSRTLTEAGIQHTFPGGTLIKLLPHDQFHMGDEKKRQSSLTDGEILRRLFGQRFRVMEAEESHPLSLHLGITDPKLKENITIEFPGMRIPLNCATAC
jgi:hypothetical protein